MASKRKIRRRDLRWDRYLAKISRSAAPSFCYSCDHPHPSVVIPKAYFRVKRQPLSWRPANSLREILVRSTFL